MTILTQLSVALFLLVMYTHVIHMYIINNYLESVIMKRLGRYSRVAVYRRLGSTEGRLAR